MSVKQIFQSLSHDQRIQVVDLTLPGIETFLKNVLAQETLSEEGESLRCRYVKLLDDCTGQIINDAYSPLKTPQIKESVFSFNDGQRRSKDDPPCQASYPDKPPIWSRNSRKGTDSTEESGVFFGIQSSQFANHSGSQENHRHSDTFESTSSRDTFMSDSETEFLEWESDIHFIEDGYMTGDNIDMNVQPNELGELYAGVLYIREQPGWHKRWFVVTETCMKCYKYRSDEKMLFEIPLQDAQFVSTDRKRSRMYPITLSIARLKDNITFATTEEKSRQEWICVINHVIKKYSEEEHYTESTKNGLVDAPPSHQHTNDLIDAPPNHQHTNDLVDAPPSHQHTNDLIDAPLNHQNTNDLIDAPLNHQNTTNSLDEQLIKRNTWHAERSDRTMNDVLSQLRVGGEEEIAELDVSLPPSQAQQQSFKELQECLPDILHKPKSKSWKGDLSKNDYSQQNNSNRKGISSKPDCDSTTLPRVKRHGSLANSLTNKAARVRSKLSTSFFKKGKKDDKLNQDSGPQSTTFSGYLMRKKGNVWKNRWCAVKDKSLYCYKDFGAELPELELRLEGFSVFSIPEREAGKPFSFFLRAEKEQLLFSAENDAELEEWLEVLEKEVTTAEKEDDEINIYPTDTLHGICPSSSQPHIETKVADAETIKEKDTSSGSVKRLSLLEAIAHKLGKHSSKGKDFPDQKCGEQEVEDASSTAMEGILCHRTGNNYIQCKVKLNNHCLEIEPLNDSSFEPTKFRLINCIVLDCTDTEGPLVMVVKRNIGKPLYLQAHTEQEYSAWKAAILADSLTTPSCIERVISSDGETEPPDSLLDQDDVFLKTDNFTTDPIQSSLKTCTAGDVGKVKVNTLKRAYSAGGIDRLKSLTKGYLVYSNLKRSPVRRTISNVMSSLDLSAPQKQRSKTFGGLGVNASVLVGIKYSSRMSLRVTNELWSRRWCVLQQNNLHFFVNPDDLSPKTSIQLTECAAERTNMKGKKFTFQLTVPSEKTPVHLAAQNEKEVAIWIDLLNAQRQRSTQESKDNLDLLNGILLSRVKSESNIETKCDRASLGIEKNGDKGLRNMSKSLVELRKIRQANDSSNEENSIKSSAVLPQKPTSLQDVLLLLHEQQLMQSMGHQRYVRVKKARGNWKKSAAAVLKDASSQPESPEAPKKNQNVEELLENDPQMRDKPRDASIRSGHCNEHTDALPGAESSEDFLGKCNKMAEGERLKTLKTETLLRKRRNSLSLEKEVLEKKLEKTQEKKTGVKKLLGKELPKDQDDIIRTKKRLDEINLKLAHVDHDMQENKSKEAAVMENITVFKTKTLRKLSGSGDSLMTSATEHAVRSLHSERRAKYRESPTGSTSLRDSFDDKTCERIASLHRKESKKTEQTTLMCLEEEMRKISPNPPRRKKHGSKKRMSSSSEGSAEDASLKGSPSTYCSSSLKGSPSTNCSSFDDEHNDYGLSQSHDKLFGWDNVKRKGHTKSSSIQGESLSMTMSGEQDSIDSSTAYSVPKTNDQHRPSLITALSQIKDFEEFLEINRRR